jgi:hypothetical protein
VDGILSLRVAFSRNYFKEENVRQFVGFYSDELKSFAEHAGTVQEAVYTAADFNEAGLADTELDDLLSELDED